MRAHDACPPKAAKSDQACKLALLPSNIHARPRARLAVELIAELIAVACLLGLSCRHGSLACPSRQSRAVILPTSSASHRRTFPRSQRVHCANGMQPSKCSWTTHATCRQYFCVRLQRNTIKYMNPPSVRFLNVRPCPSTRLQLRVSVAHAQPHVTANDVGICVTCVTWVVMPRARVAA